MAQQRPRLLYIDAYDSFANNIVALLEAVIEAEVQVIEHDDPRFVGHNARFLEFLNYFDAVVAGPGPGDPRNDADVGIIKQLWTLQAGDVLPVLGICLGFQSLCKEFGAEIEKLNIPRHGMVNPVFHNASDIFKGIGEFQVTSYHSLRVKTGPALNGCSESLSSVWASDKKYPKIKPLAWDVSDRLNGPVLMAVRHVEKPLWGVQYHPESVCTTEEGRRVVSGWWREATVWTQSHSRKVNREMVPRPNIKEMVDRFRQKSAFLASEHAYRLRDLGLLDIGDRVIWKSIYAPTLEAQELSGLLCSPENEAIILQSGKQSSGQPVDEQLGRYSIVSVLDPAATIRFQYDVASGTIFVTGTSDWNGTTSCPTVILSSTVDDVFSYLREIMRQIQCKEGPETIPFWGGLMGYISYEAGLETISVNPGHTMNSIAGGTASRPDINFVLVTRSVVIDHLTGYAFVQSVLNDDSEWAIRTQSKIVSYLQPHSNNRHPNSRVPPTKRSGSHQNGVRRPSYPEKIGTHLGDPIPSDGIKVTSPKRATYISKINQCQTSIRDGDSYELCLTDSNTLHIPHHPSTPPTLQGWHLFRRLTHANPAPFSAYLRLRSSTSTITLAGSSPERFLRWTRAGRCQFRPIKGTVRKSPGMTRARAEELLASAKERAENLMITDLVRHDLHGVVGRSGVSVPRLMQVEEYATVFQLVSVVEGAVPIAEPGDVGVNGNANGTVNCVPAKLGQEVPLGIDVLAASLPPGSMTGAPKRRSCEILARVEGAGRPRGVYSGVLGYLDVGGAGDFAVVIRTACRWDEDNASPSAVNDRGEADGEGEDVGGQEWCVGAGGAITALSDAADEWVEMLTKLNAVLGAVGVQVS